MKIVTDKGSNGVSYLVLRRYKMLMLVIFNFICIFFLYIYFCFEICTYLVLCMTCVINNANVSCISALK